LPVNDELAREQRVRDLVLAPSGHDTGWLSIQSFGDDPVRDTPRVVVHRPTEFFPATLLRRPDTADFQSLAGGSERLPFLQATLTDSPLHRPQLHSLCSDGRGSEIGNVLVRTKCSHRDCRSVPARVCAYTPRSQTLDVNMFHRVCHVKLRPPITNVWENIVCRTFVERSPYVCRTF